MPTVMPHPRAAHQLKPRRAGSAGAAARGSLAMASTSRWRTLRRLGTGAGSGHQRHVAAELLEFEATGGAALEVLLDGGAVVSLERAQGEKGEVLGELFVRAHPSSAFRKAIRAARMRVLIVPSGSPVLDAISVCVSPS